MTGDALDELLEIDIERVDARLPSAFKRERDSGREPPYEFEAAVVRTGINGFSQLFESHPAEGFLASVDAFYRELSSIVARYGGVVHQFSGDEAIYYFKTDAAAVSAAMALSAVRDVNAAAERLSAQTLNQSGFAFTVKSSVALGRLRYGALARSLSLAGTPLVEGARVLSFVPEKNENRIYFCGPVAEAAQLICDSFGIGSVALKGLPGERTLHQYSGHKSLAGLLESSERADWSKARYFRADDHLEHILRSLRDGAELMAAEKFSGLVTIVRDCRCERLADGVRREYLALIEELREKARAKADGSRYAVFLATCVIASRNLVPKAAYDREMQGLFKSLLRSEENRVVANVLDAFAWFDPDNDDILFAHLLNHKNNRILANVLVKEAMRSLNKKVAKQLESMLESKNPYFIASGIWAVGEVAAHYYQTDKVYFSSHVHLRHLIDRGVKFTSSQNEMIARQARALEAKARGEAKTIGMRAA